MSLSVAVVGASGYAGGELLRLLAAHPEFTVTTVTAHANAGRRLSEVHPHLRTYGHLVLADTTPEAIDGHDVVFVALPHGASGELTARIDAGVIVDAGADHRLEDPAAWARFYGGDYAGAWAYGLPELPRTGAKPTGKQRDLLRGATRIASPGCNVQAVSLALAPAVHAGLVDATAISAVLSVGTSGAGRSPKVRLLASEVLGSASAYGLGGSHRHIPEIEQDLGWASLAGAPRPRVTFTPVLVPMSRGILAVSQAPATQGITQADIDAAYSAAYADEAFIDILPAGTSPRTADVLGSNVAALSATLDERTGALVAVSALDNLTKGTAGAAIQSANIALGLPETAGLPIEGVAP